MFENRYIQQRIEKANTLRSMNINPYSNNSLRDIKISDFLDKNIFLITNDQKESKDKEYIVSGRIKFYRLMGKASFLKIEDDSGLLQIYVARDNLEEGFYNKIKKLIEVGDIIEVKGYPFVTNKGELSLHVSHLKILTKAISPLPEKFHGIVDKELRYRQRYLDLIMNSEVKKTFHTRSKIISLTRRFFEDRGFLEVETPMMHEIAGGANAKPFITHHNSLGVDRYLRIAPELYLKRLIVGGFEAIFEINRNFRNEGMDLTHNPEFTSIEFYWAYKTYKDLIVLTKEYLYFLLDSLNLPRVLQYDNIKIDFDKFTEISLIESLYTIADVPKDIVYDKNMILEYFKNNNIQINSDLTLGQLQGELFDEYVEKKLINPTFITDYPVDISPLSRRNDEKPYLTNRFELFIAGREISNAFCELNDPIDQLNRFKDQMSAKENGDDEAHHMDEDFVNALSYGMAPTAGQGIGIDRLVMMLTNQTSIKDVLLFPAMKPLGNSIDNNINQGEN